MLLGVPGRVARRVLAGDLGVWRLPDQVVRLGVLVAIAVVALLVARAKFVPASFGEEGHYRTEARLVVARQPLRYAGWQICAECHEEEAEKKNKSYHRSLACEVCHGPAWDHSEDAIEYRPFVPKKRADCLACHAYLPSRPTGFPQIVELQHNPMETCTTCHNPHDPTPPETVESCSACHAQIARTKAISHHWQLDCEVCHEAAPEHKQSPRSRLPTKPMNREFCGRCHGNGAAQPEKIPQKIPHVDLATHGGRYLCWQCHYPHFPEAG